MEKSQPYIASYETSYPPTNSRKEEEAAPRTFGLGSFEDVYRPPKYSWFEESQRNKPQSNSLGAALFIFASGGMSLAWSVGFGPICGYISQAAQMHLRVCWFVAVILGSIAATVLIDKLRKRTFNMVASVLVVINGILFLSAPESVAALAIARYCDGIAFGLTVIPAIMAGSEQSVKILRGLVLSIESVGVTMGIMLQAIYSNLWESNASFTSTQMHGGLAVMYGLIALIFACFLTIESPSFYLRRNQDTDAIECLRKLQRPQVVTTETYALFYENKKTLEEDETRGMVVNFTNGLIPMAKLCIFRVLVSMSFSLPVSLALVTASEAMGNTDVEVPIIFYGTLRFMGTMVAIFSLDTLGRKYPSAIAMLIGGGLLIAVGAMYASNCNLNNDGESQTVVALLLTYQIMAGICSATITVYLGEAFSISVKPYFILIILVAENIVQIIIRCSFDVNSGNISAFSCVLGVLQIFFGVAIWVALPETKKTTLREALNMFKGILSLKQ